MRELHAGASFSVRKSPGLAGTIGNPAARRGIFIARGDEYFSGRQRRRRTFTPNTPGPPQAGLATVEEGTFVDGHWVPGRRLAGDDTIEGEIACNCVATGNQTVPLCGRNAGAGGHPSA